ncbi:helix-turn-helix domain-containing protein [Algoriphagus sp. oki45]|uniref:helix-turn-helix domain-containing protein n=1 Tax=Algoriphagus sp. oki45 TaxID=3067294 RepID=UPI0030C6F16E
MVYLEMGFDNLFFYPYNFESIEAKIRNLIERKKTFDWFESEDFQRWIKLSYRPMALIKKNYISLANDVFLEHLAISNGKLNSPFSEMIDFSSIKSAEIELSRFFKQLTHTVLLKEVPISPVKSLDLLLFRGKNSPTHAFLVEIVGQKISEYNLDYKIYPSKSFGQFTSREKEVLLLSEKGLPMKEIADRLSLSARTIERHRSNILKKTNSSNILEAISKVNR